MDLAAVHSCSWFHGTLPAPRKMRGTAVAAIGLLCIVGPTCQGSGASFSIVGDRSAIGPRQHGTPSLRSSTRCSKGGSICSTIGSSVEHVVLRLRGGISTGWHHRFSKSTCEIVNNSDYMQEWWANSTEVKRRVRRKGSKKLWARHTYHHFAQENLHALSIRAFLYNAILYKTDVTMQYRK